MRSPLGSILRGLIVLLFLAAAGFVAIKAFRAGETPAIELADGPPAIGRNATFEVSVSEPSRGLAHVRFELLQGERTLTLVDERYAPQPSHLPWASSTPELRLSVPMSAEILKTLDEAPVTVRITAEGATAWLSKPDPAVVERTLPVRLRPPSVEVLSQEVYPARGGSETVVYRVGETAVRHGVQVGSWFFPGAPLPGAKAGEQFAFFGIPYDFEAPETIRVVAEDDVANVANLAFVDRVVPRPYDNDTIRLSDAVMRRIVDKVSASVPEVPREGSLVERYLFINRDLRRDNRARLRSIAEESAQQFFWNQAFFQMPAKAVSAFADRRAYVYDGQIIDRQDHLGFDLASTVRAPIPAANSGRVLLAEILGIYGLAVVIDHGFGLMTLYAHLSSTAVARGDIVKRGQTIGRTGATGLALGDHLHFTTLIRGLPVNPLEWWDESWVQNRIAAKLGPGLQLTRDPR